MASESKICLFSSNYQILVKQVGEQYALPTVYDVEKEYDLSLQSDENVMHINNDGRDVYYKLLTDALPPQNGFTQSEIRPLFADMQAEDFADICKARQFVHWDEYSKYCPRCGERTFLSLPNAKKCPQCQTEFFPPVTPAIIVRIERGEEILLVRAHNFRGKHYGLVAGFVEPGETLEECVRREVKEETGLEIADIKYFGSQPWPFPSGMMIGFTAQYSSGNIVIQEEELADAAFFSKEKFPELPNKMSIARRLIDDWAAKH